MVIITLFIPPLKGRMVNTCFGGRLHNETAQFDQARLRRGKDRIDKLGEPLDNLSISFVASRDYLDLSRRVKGWLPYQRNQGHSSLGLAFFVPAII